MVENILAPEEYLELWNIPWRYATAEDYGPYYADVGPPTWDGETLTLPWLRPNDKTRAEDVGWVFHEIAHYVFAPEKSRSLPNFGLGPDPGGGGWAEVVAEASRSSHPFIDEASVCLVTVALMLECGLPAHVIRAHVEEYNIGMSGVNDMFTDEERLYFCHEAGFDAVRMAKIYHYLE